MTNTSNISSEEELLALRSEGKISEAEYQDLLTAMKHYHSTDAAESENRGAAKSMSWYLWSPFHSEAAKEIYAHMTKDEKMSSMTRGGLLGLWVAAAFATPQCIILLPALFGIKRSAGAVSIGVVLLIVFLISIPIIRKKNKIFLCSTEWAKSKGYTIDNI